MSEIHRDLHTTTHEPRRPLVRRSVLVTSALTAAAVIAAAVGIAVTGQPDDGPVRPGPATASGQELLLAAATTALQQPEGTGKYWHVTLAARDAAQRPRSDSSFQTWADRDGVNWLLSDGGGSISGRPEPYKPSMWTDRGFSLCGVYITFVELQNLPTTADALKVSITGILTETDADPTYLEQRVLYGLVALVSQLPAPPKVRAAAFQAIAAYPGVVNLGPVDRGQALQIPAGGPNPARLVIDPVAALIRETDFVVVFNQTMQAADGSSWVITAGWTDSLPR